MISDKGKEEVKIIPERISYKYLEKFDSFNKFKERPSQKRNISGDIQSMETILTPDEEIESIFRNRDNILVQELLRNLIKIKPSDFERVIIDVILALGYGKNFEEMANVLGQPKDQGIDGEIPQDKLGFEKIFLQAKRWNIEQTVGASQIRDFIGALTIKHAKKGIFITTTKFSKDALDTAKKDSDHNIILIDGNELAKLMIEYNVGIREIKKYTTKEIDKDYFEYLEG
jgi:restriction system protein